MIRPRKAGKSVLAGALLGAWGCLLADDALARTWRVEKDGSGDYQVIQDALDSAAPGDTILVGPGRFDDFEPQTFTDLGTYAMIMRPRAGPLTVIGAGPLQTTVGPDILTLSVDGYRTYCLRQEVSAPPLEVSGITFEHVERAVRLEGTASFSDCVFRASDRFLIVLGPHVIDSLTITDCVFDGGTWNPFGVATLVGTADPGLRVVRCTFRNMELAVHPAACTNCLIEDCLFEDVWVPLEFYSGGTVLVKRCTFVRPGNIAISARDGTQVTLVDSRIDSGAFRTIRLTSDARMVANGVIVGWGQLDTINICTTCVAAFTNSDILNGGSGPTLSVSTLAETQAVLDFTNNYWGTADSSQIAAWIVEGDVPLDPPLAEVDFVPFRTKSIPVKADSMGNLKFRFSGQH